MIKLSEKQYFKILFTLKREQIPPFDEYFAKEKNVITWIESLSKEEANKLIDLLLNYSKEEVIIFLKGSNYPF